MRLYSHAQVEEAPTRSVLSAVEPPFFRSCIFYELLKEILSRIIYMQYRTVYAYIKTKCSIVTLKHGHL